MYKIILLFKNGKPVYLTYKNKKQRLFDDLFDVLLYLNQMGLRHVAGVVREGVDIEKVSSKGKGKVQGEKT
jgi:hypothetical protein